VKTKKVLSCEALLPPDTTVLAEGAPDPHGRRDAACMKALMAAPAVSAELTLDITPWDAAALKTRTATLPDEAVAAAHARDNVLEGAIHTYGAWYCQRLRCDCGDDVRFQRGDDWMTKAFAVIPAAPPAQACR
jgi:hypothetical protein